MYNYKSCMLCPNKCGADRTASAGLCGAAADIRAARASLHMWEEPCLSGETGSGTIFFSGCPLSCVFCQNSEISHKCSGKAISVDRLCDIFYELREQKAHNINLVSPTPYIPQIAEAIKKVKVQGFDLPFVYNSSGYELAESLKLLDGLIDIYLPDFKYMSEPLGAAYSKIKNYPSVAIKAIDEMVRQQPEAEFDNSGMMTHGVIVRHLVLPSHIDDSKNVIKYLYGKYKDKIYLSIMSQYTPHGELERHPELKRKLTEEEYDEVVDYAIDIGITQAFIQDGEAAEESFIPVFDNRGI